MLKKNKTIMTFSIIELTDSDINIHIYIYIYIYVLKSFTYDEHPFLEDTGACACCCSCDL